MTSDENGTGLSRVVSRFFALIEMDSHPPSPAEEFRQFSIDSFPMASKHPLLRVASSNAGKIAEFRLAMLWCRGEPKGEGEPGTAPRGRQAADWVVEALPGIEALPECVEDGDTFSANARKKALHYSRLTSCFTGGLVLGDDSGLEVDALGGSPGVRSRRFAGPNATDARNNAKLLDAMWDVPASKRGAQFVCVLALAQAGEVVAEFTGVARGLLLEAPRGENGFGYDPLFLDPDCNKTFAELEPEEKLERSHRGKALRAMFEWLERYS